MSIESWLVAMSVDFRDSIAVHVPGDFAYRGSSHGALDGTGT